MSLVLKHWNMPHHSKTACTYLPPQQHHLKLYPTTSAAPLLIHRVSYVCLPSADNANTNPLCATAATHNTTHQGTVYETNLEEKTFIKLLYFICVLFIHLLICLSSCLSICLSDVLLVHHSLRIKYNKSSFTFICVSVCICLECISPGL